MDHVPVISKKYVLFQFWCYFRRRSPPMDFIFMVQPEQGYGVPMGGLGTGTIGRNFKGDFDKYQLLPGFYEYGIVDANQFILTVKNSKNVTVYQNVLSVRGAPKSGCLNAWEWNFPGDQAEYTALYPRAWTEYDIPECNIKLICTQISAVIPHNYKDSSFPGCVFIWNVENNSSELLSVSITMCIESYNDAIGGGSFDLDHDDVKIHGVKIDNKVSIMDCTIAFAARETNEITVSSTTFDPKGSGAVLWDQLYNGNLDGKVSSYAKYVGKIAGAVSANAWIQPFTYVDLEFVLVWHMPRINFRDNQITYRKYYTQYFGIDSDCSTDICHYGISHYNRWEKELDEWQKPILDNEKYPDWYKSAIFNELYYISDGGGMWVLLEEQDMKGFSPTDVRRTYGKFGYLEGHEYRMYNTYDVHFYASFALADLFPKLQQSIQYEFCQDVVVEDRSRTWFLYDGHIGYRKKRNCVAHDVGDPDSDPFIHINAYTPHDVSDWKDLNLKFVLQCYRDYAYTSDEGYLRDMWPKVKILMKNSLAWDTDGDGVIENTGFPDQTYDAWIMNGVSAYCGSLWLCALCMTVKMADILEDIETKKKYSIIFEKAKVSFNKKLWNGSYYDFDTKSENNKSIMSDQLCGIWYLLASGITDDVLPPENVEKALQTIFEYNVCKFNNGQSGAVNGMLPSGEIDKCSVQSQEAWTGVVYGLASLFFFKGMLKEGFKTAEGVYETIYNKIGLGFNTPEAYYESKYFRAVGYMRPLSVWSMQIALRSLESAAK